MRILRVFPRRTSLTPKDELAWIGEPGLLRPEADEVHVSCTFTWDKAKAERLQKTWAQYYPVVKLGGPAYGERNGDFVPGRYVKQGVVFTSRGCGHNCPWCLVKTPLRLLPVIPGNIVQDDNFLQCPRQHREQVYEMLKTQRRIEFLGGLESDLLTVWDVEQLRSLNICQLFFACDTRGALKYLRLAGKILAGMGRRRLRCYVLLAFNGQTIGEAVEHLESVWAAGFMPHAQLYQPPDRFIRYPQEWRELARRWSRPAIMQSLHKAD